MSAFRAVFLLGSSGFWLVLGFRAFSWFVWYLVFKPVFLSELYIPAIAKWVQGYGHVEIGDQEGFGFVVRAIDYGGVVFEDDKPMTLAGTTASLEKGLIAWFEEK